ncbi:hypothetical protein [Alicyclobacillus acidoterrestris]|uniref:Uncharacterized protein n=1 Tax=Alicyclobacillus acidoterrestris (strain ATCC 49025 / DSM 3922 / CIP 106132 / NCIMB 13137 / GD3B) TaxID=1356854 RepID=T0CTG5_ALIAG|nr:hypothetical protein [Alicyclobacillus acidoterrestris]EPZ42697.1 hypothetical protein N007_14430 [Alicyclobacillus acidoterrestris ATCC 49025]UNO47229.1 hypothetical protein K1I37_10780 [Alicyclobacillus acidoterrestris]
MRFVKASLISICIVLMVSGCHSESNPSYSALHNVPQSQLNILKSAIKKSGLKGLELPTKIPFSIEDVRIAQGENLYHHMDIYMGGGKPLEVLEESAAGVANNATLLSTTGNEANTALSDGTKAYFSNNGSVSQLGWIKNGILYDLASSKSGAKRSMNEPDLSEAELIQIAGSFE